MAQPRRYFVFDDRITDKLGGVPIKLFQGDRTVMMTDDQARYFVDQNVIGLQKRTEPPPGVVTEPQEATRSNLSEDAAPTPARMQRRRRAER